MNSEIEYVFKELYYRPTDEEYRRALESFSDDRTHIRDMIDKLSWDASEAEQQYAIDYLPEHMLPSEYIYLVLADSYDVEISNGKIAYLKIGKDKSKWENAAKTIIKIGWPKVDRIMIPVFCWLLDPNWPGSILIYNFLLSLPKEVLQAKMKQILDNPQWFESYDYEDFAGQIEDLCEDAQIIL